MLYTDRLGLQQLSAQPCGEALQCGKVLDLQVIRRDVAVLHRALVELTEKFLKNVVNADSSQNVALFYVAVQ